MAINFWESFERGDNLQAVVNANSSIVTTPAPPYGVRLLDIGSGSTGFCNYLLTAGATKVVHSWIRYSSAASGLTIIEFRNGTTVLSSLRRNASNQLELYNGTSTLLGNSSNALYLINTWRQVQFKFVVSATVGILEVKLDNIIVATFSNLNTGTTNPDQIRIHGGNENFFKDVVIADSYLGVTGEPSMPQRGRGNYNAWTGTWDDINEIPNDGGTTEIESTATGEKESVTFAASGLGSTVTPLAVAVTAIAKGASGEQLKLGYRQAGVDYIGSAQDLPTTYISAIRRLDETNPADGLAWEVADLTVEAVAESVIP